MCTHVVKLGKGQWPAWKRPDGLLVDVRLFAQDGKTLAYDPIRLADAELPPHLITSAADSEPKGLLLFPWTDHDPHKEYAVAVPCHQPTTERK